MCVSERKCSMKKDMQKEDAEESVWNEDKEYERHFIAEGQV